MTIQNQIRSLLLLVAILLLGVLWHRSNDGGSNVAALLETELHAQAAQASSDVLFFPVGNQDVRKFVFWDRRANEIHIYTGNGKFEETWQIGALGQDLKKR